MLISSYFLRQPWQWLTHWIPTDEFTQVRKPCLRFLTFLSSGQFLACGKQHMENEPTEPANEDLVGANSFQDVCATMCRQKKKHCEKRPTENVIKKSTFCRLTCMNYNSRHEWLDTQNSCTRTITSVSACMSPCIPICGFFWQVFKLGQLVNGDSRPSH